MPSESVWCEQVDTALVDYIKGILSRAFSGFTVPVSILKPDADFKIEEYPCVTVYHLYSVRDNDRYFPGSVVVNRDYENNTLVLEKGAVPYNLMYQFDFWTRTQTDMNEMLRVWLGYHPDRDFNLSVVDMSDNPRDCYVLQIGDVVKSDSIEGVDRTFHTSITYRIHVELDEKIQTVENMITEVPSPTTVKIGG